ncbi:MAG: DUF2281 domain-containing protein [Chloroflexaceae bacterium]|nr:DUF2281 domain-containing protein [Chloroflexaceae bacterium]
MDQESLWNDFRALPPNARQQVADFIAFLRTRYAAQSQSTTKGGDLKDNPFIGMWANRADMTDSTAWVRSLRANEWQRDHE